LGLHQVGRPLSGDLFEFSYGEPDVSVTLGPDGKPRVSGASASLVTHSDAADRCASANTMQATPLSGPPGP
jgi:hypothetical protein